MSKKVWKYLSNGLFGFVLLVLFIPSWRVGFQGWFQGIFMVDLQLEKAYEKPLPPAVNTWQVGKTNDEALFFGDFYDKPIVLSFWATWCPPCRAELKTLNALKADMGDMVHFISCSEETVETITNSGLTDDYDFLYSTKRIPPFFNMRAYPTLCIIDKNQHLIFTHEGAGGLDTEKNIQFLKGLAENQ